jgi:hypothetical protein
MNRFLLLFCLPFSLISAVDAVELTSVELVPKTDWTYFYNSGGVDDLALNSALETSGFYANWTSVDFAQPTVAGLDWQPGTLPIGQRNVRLDWPTELATSIDLPIAAGRRRTIFLRRSFLLPDDIPGPFGLEFFFEDGATVYLDGQEVARENCCVVTYGQDPIARAPEFLDYANSSHWNGLAQIRIDELKPGEHTFAVSIHDSDQYNPSQSFRTGFDLRLYAPGNARPWTNQDYQADWAAPENWLFGLPGTDDVAIFPQRTSSRINNDQLVSIAGLNLAEKNIEGNVSAPVILTLTNASEQAALAGTGGELTIENLTISLPTQHTNLGLFQPKDGLSFNLFPNWESLVIEQAELPNIGLAEWDTSRLSEGILSIINTEMAVCDFDASGLCGLTDLEQLMTDIAAGQNEPRSDINNDGLVNLEDRDEWLVTASASIGVSPFLAGDANLDGSVDAADLMQLGINWQIQRVGWQNADFNGDGKIDAKDLNLIGRNWQQTVTRLPANPAIGANPVPEPISYLLLLFGGFAILHVIRQIPRSTVATILAMTVFLLWP